MHPTIISLQEILGNSYDKFAKEYKASKELPFRKYIEEYTLFKIIGDLKGLNVLDLACGEGIYSRKMKNMGAKGVIGVDISSEMIKLAEESEKQNPIGCKYIVKDVLKLEKLDDFDLVIGAYLLNYAQSNEELFNFCQAAFKNLKVGGRFVGFNDNPFHKFNDFLCDFRKYGFTKECTIDKKDGDPILYSNYNKDGGCEFSFYNYWFSPITYEKAFNTSGFTNFCWEGPFLDEKLTKEQKLHFDLFMENPPLIGFSMSK